MRHDLAGYRHTVAAIYALVDNAFTVNPSLSLAQLEGHLAAFLGLALADVRAHWPGLGLAYRQAQREQRHRKDE